MTRLQALTELRDRVRVGECPMWTQITGGIGLRPDNRHLSFYEAFNGSLDAAKALHEAVLPGWRWALTRDTANVYLTDRPYDGFIHSGSCDGKPARAWLLAIIAALIAQETP